MPCEISPGKLCKRLISRKELSIGQPLLHSDDTKVPIERTDFLNVMPTN